MNETVVCGEVIARWERDRGLLRTDAGSVVAFTVPVERADDFDVGVDARLHLDGGGSQVDVTFLHHD